MDIPDKVAFNELAFVTGTDVGVPVLPEVLKVKLLMTSLAANSPVAGKFTNAAAPWIKIPLTHKL